MEKAMGRKRVIHYGWIVMAMGLLTTIGAHGFGRMAYTLDPSSHEGWSSTHIYSTWPLGHRQFYRIPQLSHYRRIFSLQVRHTDRYCPCSRSHGNNHDPYGICSKLRLRIRHATVDGLRERGCLCPGHGLGIRMVRSETQRVCHRNCFWRDRGGHPALPV